LAEQSLSCIACMLATMRRPSSMAGSTRNLCSSRGGLEPSSSVCSRGGSPAGQGLARPASRANWKTFPDEGGDIAAAMAAVEIAMKKKGMAKESEDLRSSMEEADRRTAQETQELAAEEVERTTKREAEQEKAVRKLRSAMKKGCLKALRKAIDNAVAIGAPEGVVREAQCLGRLENQVQAALFTADLDDIRKAVKVVEQGRILASFPQEAPWALEQQLQYWSERRDNWVDCHVIEVAVDSRIQINLKKKVGYWFSLNDQRKKFRVPEADIAIAAVAPMVRLDEARALLDKADALQTAVLSKDVATINNAIAQAGGDKALDGLVSRADTFVHKAMKVRTEEDEVEWRSDVAASWHAAKKNIQCALRAAADREELETAGQGWDNLEKDLVIERLTALDEAFDSTDLPALEFALKQLASEDFQVPVAVIDEANHALSAIAKQHQELEVAVREGDIDVIRLALELSLEHFCPEALVCKARTALEFVVTLDRAIKSRDPQLLAATLSQVGHDVVEMPLLQRARGIHAATKELQEAMDSGNIDAIAAACELVGEDSLPEELVCQAKMASSLDAAIKSQDMAAIEETIRIAKAKGIPTALLDKAQQDLTEEITKKAVEAVQAAIQSNSVDAIKDAIRVAEEQGVTPTLIEEFKQELEEDRLKQQEQKNLEEAVRKRDEFLAGLPTIQPDNILALRGAITEGEAFGFEQELEPIRKAIEDELSRRMEHAKEERAAHEKLAGEFKSAKEVQDFAGNVLVAQWRAAVLEISKPLVISEE